MVAKYERATLAHLPDLPRESAVYDHGFDISFVRADVNVVPNVTD